MRSVSISRRQFMTSASAVGAGLGVLGMAGTTSAQQQRPFPKAVIWGMLPDTMSDEDRIKLAKSCGFDGIEMPPLPADDHAK